MNHKYSTWILFIFGVLVMGTLVIADIDGMGTQNVLAKFTSGGVIANSSVTDNGTVVNVLTSLSVNGSIVCTASNGVCVGGGNGTVGHEYNQDLNTTSNVTFNQLKLIAFNTIPQIFADADSNTGIAFEAPDVFSLWSGGSKRIYITTLGVGINGYTDAQHTFGVNGSSHFEGSVLVNNELNVSQNISERGVLLNNLYNDTSLINANNNSAFTYLNTLGVNNTNIMSSNVTTNLRIDNVNGTSNANNNTLTGKINANNVTFTTFVTAVATNMTATNSQNVTTNARIDNVNASVNANNLTVFSYISAIQSNISSINITNIRNLSIVVTGTNVTLFCFWNNGTSCNSSYIDQTGAGSTSIKNATFVVVGTNTTLFMGLTDGTQYNTSFNDQSSAGGTSVKNLTIVQALNGINTDNVTLFIGLTDGSQSNKSILLHVPKTPWDEADTNGGYFRENDFDNPSGYGTIWGAVAINIGTLATVNGTGDGSGNGGLSNDPGIVSITTNTTSMGGYAYNTSSIQYQLKEGWGSLNCFRAFARQGEIASVAQTSNWSTGRFGFMDIFTNANVVDGVFINYSWRNATTAILNGVVRNNSVANYTTTNVLISNGSVYCGMVYLDNTTARFSLYQNGTPGLGVSVWNDSIAMYPWNLGRNTGAGMVWFATSNSTGAYIFGEARYTNIFMNKTLYR